MKDENLRRQMEITLGLLNLHLTVLLIYFCSRLILIILLFDWDVSCFLMDLRCSLENKSYNQVINEV